MIKKWFFTALTGIAVALQSSADVRIAQKWSHASKNTTDHTFELAADVAAKKGDMFVLTYAANKKSPFSFRITSTDGQVSAETRYDKSNGASSGVIYYRVMEDGKFNLAAHQSENVISACGAYHLASDSGQIEELVSGERMVGNEGAEQINSAYYWGGELNSGLLIEGVSSYRPLGVPADVDVIIAEGDNKRLSGYTSFSDKKNLNMSWDSDPAGGKGNFSSAGVVFIEADALPVMLGFISH